MKVNEGKQQERKFYRAHVLICVGFIVFTVLLKERFAWLSISGMVFGCVFSLSTIACYGFLLKLLSGREFSVLGALFVLSLKLALLTLLFLRLGTMELKILYSAMFGFLSFIWAGLYLAWQEFK